jgi:hypothetical protein
MLDDTDHRAPLMELQPVRAGDSRGVVELATAASPGTSSAGFWRAPADRSSRPLADPVLRAAHHSWQT